MKPGHFITIDWGTTNLRGYLVSAAGEIVNRHSAPDGIRSCNPGQHLKVVRQFCAPWLAGYQVDYITLGCMLGSEFGLRAVAMVECPATKTDIVGAISRVDEPEFPPSGIVPGVCNRSSPDHLAGMMRGEETQVIGAMQLLGVGSGLFCLPGTHTKWVRVEASTFRHIGTAMTGEIFDMLRKFSVLKLALGEWDGKINTEAFLDGVRIAERGLDSLHSMFITRAQLVVGEETDYARRASRLSGILIGSEIRSMLMSNSLAQDLQTYLVCDGQQGTLYQEAAKFYGNKLRLVSATEAFIAGALQIYNEVRG